VNGDVYVTRNLRGKWVVRIEGQHDTQYEAVQAGRRVARLLKVELKIRGRNGKIRRRDSEGNDPPQVLG
jgi:hypothetical protein